MKVFNTVSCLESDRPRLGAKGGFSQLTASLNSEDGNPEDLMHGLIHPPTLQQ